MLKKYRKEILCAGAGIVFGMIFMVILVAALMPSLMIETYPTTKGFDQTVASLEQAIESNGWQVSNVWDINKSLEKHEQTLKPRVTLIKLCHPEYAADILKTDRFVSTMMPCTFAVWEDDNGKVYLSKMNLSLMSRIFGGNIAEIMGKKVARDEEVMLRGLIDN